MSNKKVIAREGLILLLLILIGLSFIYWADIIKNKQLLPAYLFEFDDGKKYKAALRNDENYRNVSTDKELNALAEVIKKEENLPADLKLKNITLISGKTKEFLRIEQKIANLKKVGLIILFITYPFYLLIRFVVWAIRTLNEEKDKTN